MRCMQHISKYDIKHFKNICPTYKKHMKIYKKIQKTYKKTYEKHMNIQQYIKHVKLALETYYMWENIGKKTYEKQKSSTYITCKTYVTTKTCQT